LKAIHCTRNKKNKKKEKGKEKEEETKWIFEGCSIGKRALSFRI